MLPTLLSLWHDSIECGKSQYEIYERNAAVKRREKLYLQHKYGGETLMTAKNSARFTAIFQPSHRKAPDKTKRTFVQQTKVRFRMTRTRIELMIPP